MTDLLHGTGAGLPGEHLTDDEIRKLLPPLRTFAVLRYDPKAAIGGAADALETVYVTAHSPVIADNVLVFQTMSVDARVGVLTRTVRGFSSWIDFDVVPMAAETLIKQ